MPIFASRRPTLWTCRPLATMPQHELRIAALIFHQLNRGDLWIA